jgi:hypothetical protein
MEIGGWRKLIVFAGEIINTFKPSIDNRHVTFLGTTLGLHPQKCLQMCITVGHKFHLFSNVRLIHTLYNVYYEPFAMETNFVDDIPTTRIFEVIVTVEQFKKIIMYKPCSFFTFI